MAAPRGEWRFAPIFCIRPAAFQTVADILLDKIEIRLDTHRPPPMDERAIFMKFPIAYARLKFMQGISSSSELKKA